MSSIDPSFVTSFYVQAPCVSNTPLSPMSESSLGLDLQLEEELDNLDPLRHLRHSAKPGSDDILPSQLPSVIGEIIQIPIYARRDGLNSSDLINVQLALDASPGCGGVAWPAGEVISSKLH